MKYLFTQELLKQEGPGLLQSIYITFSTFKMTTSLSQHRSRPEKSYGEKTFIIIDFVTSGKRSWESKKGLADDKRTTT